MTGDPPIMWSNFGRSIRGASHRRRGLENQDAIICVSGDNAYSPVIVAVSDGHGSPSSYRSDVGARLAVQVASDCVSRFLTSQQFMSETMCNYICEDLAREIHMNWKEAVDRHLNTNDAHKCLSSDFSDNGQSFSADAGIGANPYLIYGATILCVGLLRQTAIFLQLGDGDILAVTSGGDTQRPLLHDRKIFTNETTSLCMTDAWRHFSIRALKFDDTNTPDLIIVASDGYSNSFPGCDEDFLKVGADYLELIRSKGYDVICDELEDILIRTSQKGSCDDITMGMIYRSRK